MSVSEILDGISNVMVDDGGANYLQLYESIEFVHMVATYIMGFLVVLIVVGLPLIIALEVMFINIPTFQSALEKLTEKNKKAEKVLGIVLRDAIKAIERANTCQTGRSANLIYLSIKIKAIIISFIIVGVIIGPLQALVLYILNCIAELISKIF